MRLYRALVWILLVISFSLGIMAIWIDLYQTKLSLSAIIIMLFTSILFISEPEEKPEEKKNGKCNM